jgi:uncharacterized protein (TIGR00730 family)
MEISTWSDASALRPACLLLKRERHDRPRSRRRRSSRSGDPGTVASMTTLRRVCVYCGSKPGRSASFTEAAHALGRQLAAQRIGLVYGGASVGLMGTVADAVLAAGGEAIGVIPGGLFEDEVAHTELTELHVVTSLHERKALMSELADAFIALPGGYGTIDELVEALTWAQLGIHTKPVGLLDVDGYFEHLLAFFDRAVVEGLLGADQRRLLLRDVDPVALIGRLAETAARTPTS